VEYRDSLKYGSRENDPVGCPFQRVGSSDFCGKIGNTGVLLSANHVRILEPRID